ncbi:MAG: hypothetical protein AAF657_17070 [Acidobacteriota bacterium]
MLKKAPWLAGLLLCLPGVVRAQAVSPTANDLKALGREVIIERAVDEIRQRHEDFSREHFDQIKVLVNESSVYVGFAMSVRYVPLNSRAYYDLFWGLVDPSGVKRTYSPVANPREAEDLEQPRFFQPNAASARAIAFVLGALDIDAGALHDRETVTIREQASTFEVEVESPQTGSSYTVAKGTGEVLDARHSHNLPAGGGESRFEELVD